MESEIGTVAEVARILEEYPRDRSSLIVILQRVQSELGYISEEAVAEIARFLGISPSEVYGVATFYTQFRFIPSAKYQIKVCLGTACHVRGGERVMEAMVRELNIEPGEITPDRKFGLERIACFGSCALAPVMVVNETIYGRMNPDKARKIVEELKP